MMKRATADRTVQMSTDTGGERNAHCADALLVGAGLAVHRLLVQILLARLALAIQGLPPADKVSTSFLLLHGHPTLLRAHPQPW